MDTTIRVPAAVRDQLAARAKANDMSIGEMVGHLTATAPMTDTEITAHHERLTRTLGWSQPPAAPDETFTVRLGEAFTASADGGTASL